LTRNAAASRLRRFWQNGLPLRVRVDLGNRSITLVISEVDGA